MATSTKVISYEEYCQRINLRFVQRLEIYEKMVEEGKLSEYKYIQLADLIKTQREGELLHPFYLFRIEKKDALILVTEIE